jgi:radical SAM protein with 4Fe4S-binding SPASM domain
MLPLPFPLAVYVETTNRCNFRCGYCPMSRSDFSEKVGGYRDITLADFDRLCRSLEEGPRLRVLRFYFMGEPLLNRALPEMISMAHRRGLAERTELTSNGALLTEETARALAGSGLDYLRISISAVDERRHREVTRTRVPPEKIRENLRRFKELREELGQRRPFLYVKQLASPHEEENARFLELYRGIGDEVVIEAPMNWNGYEDVDLLSGIYGSKVPSEEGGPHHFPKRVCPFPFYTLMISANGDVTVCCVDWNKATLVGNAFKESLLSIWRGPALRDLRALHIAGQRKLNPSCANCEFLFTAPDNLDNLPEAVIRAILAPERSTSTDG